MKKIILTCIMLTFILLGALCQQTHENQWGIRFSGFMKTDIFYDTRQTSASNAIREGHFFLFPDDILRDEEGKDLNANPSFHMLNIQSRLRGDISGPDAFGAKTSGAIEAEFFGTGESDLNGLRLRHAFVKLDWTKVSLLVGQSWHPLFPSESFPGTISFNTGVPYVPFSRNPQARISYKAGTTTLQMTLYSQRDFASMGVDGSSSKYMRNSALPGSNIQIKIPAGDIVTFWAGADYKKLRPEIKTSANYETKSTIGSIILFSNVKVKTKSVTLSMMGSYAQNGTDLMMIGGYAISEIKDLTTQEKKYTTMNSASLWADISTNGNKVAFGLFTGFCSNLGASDNISGQVYSRGSNIDHTYRISPRVVFTSGKLSFASEIEATTAAYGTMQPDGNVIDTRSVTNVRILVSSIYRF